MNAVAQPITLLDIPAWTRRQTADLVGLPNELLDNIANYLEGTDLFKLRTIRNRTICDGIDYAWVKRFFARRQCRTTDTSIAHLEAITRSQFANCIYSIVIEMHLVNISLETERQDTESPSVPTKSYLDAHSWSKSVGSKLATIFKNTTNLSEIGIRMPPKVGYRTDGIPQFWLPVQERLPSLTNQLEASAKHRVFKLTAARVVFCSIIKALRDSKERLENLTILDFTSGPGEPLIPLSPPMLEDLVRVPSVQNLTRLELLLQMLTESPHEAIPSIVKLIKGNTRLSSLRLWAGPGVHYSFMTPSGAWSPLINALAIQPSFRLQALDLDSLVLSGDTTLASIIRAHSHTLRCITLKHTNFRRPNSLRAFFLALADTDLELFAMKDFRVYGRCWMTTVTLSYQYRLDAVLQWSDAEGDGKNDAYLDWADITWDGGNHTEWIRYDNQAGTHSGSWMKDQMKDLIFMAECCGIDN
ncbi:uncharacterized protein K460DRAFT_394112 [Cucurbitaria berberidis CBS 394.84]|uniref:F-box domain-containing protein n=1 Tax=Cucurbitaria berberidis CBS 394.84 TaxID=1168544 RepID=A0A9P4GQ24_9PLEO|nr:uncharacterized protein K460DRAFT_394112 [Cucurbitaria berberidis CBS 394.84]KAF1849237.1 hypothetical protein K460DRAFT_394112 [Cucurbitaria berberidis CBS 394.84]